MSTALTQGQRLAAQAAAAAEVRSYQTDPDVVALRVEQVRAQVERLMWTGMVLGLAFTMVNVQQFAAAGAVVGSLAWCAAWLLDPMVSLVLLGVLRAEQVTARWQVPMGHWPRAAKWSLLSGTYVMNTWSSWVAGSPSGIVLHSVPVLTVFVAAEAVTDCQDKLTECVHRAHAYATERADRRTRAEQGQHAARTGQTTHPAAVGSGLAGATTPVLPVPVRAEESGASGGDSTPRPQPLSTGPVWGAVSGNPAPTRRDRRAPTRPVARPAARRAPATTRAGGRVLFADYLATARTALSPGIEITPAWVRQVTGCSRGLSSRLAAELRAEYVSVPAVPPLTREQSTEQTERPEGRAA